MPARGASERDAQLSTPLGLLFNELRRAPLLLLRRSWLKCTSGLFDDATPSSSLGPMEAQAAPTHRGAQPEQRHSLLLWPQVARLRPRP